MAYTKNYDPWVNGNTNAIDADVLNAIENGIDGAHSDISTLQGEVLALQGGGGGGSLTWSTKVVGNTGDSIAAFDGIFVDTTGGAFNLVLPAGTDGDTVKFVDVAGNFATANFTIAVASGENFMGVTDDTLVLSTDYDYVELVYSGATYGWIITSKP